MKILSNTENGGRVVEFSKEEFRELYALVRSCDPQVEDLREAVWQLQEKRSEFEYGALNEFDFTEVLANIRAFREMQFNTNKIQNLLDGIKKAIKP